MPRRRQSAANQPPFNHQSAGYRHPLRAPVDRHRPQRQRQCTDRGRHADPRQRGKRRARADRHAAEPRAGCIAEVERALIESRRQIRRMACAVDDQHLQRRHDRESQNTPHEDSDHGRNLRMHRAGENGQDHDDCQQKRDQRGHQPPVRELAAERAAHRQAEAEQQQHEGDRVRRETAHVFENRRDVGEGGKQAGRREHADAEHHQHLRVFQHAEFAHKACLLHLDSGRQANRERQRGKNTDTGDRPEGRAPAHCLPERGAERHAEHIGERQAREHQRDGLRAAVRRNQTGRDHRPDAEERAMAERRDDARGHQHRIARRDRAQQVADDKDPDQAHQRFLARHIGHGDRDNRAAMTAGTFGETCGARDAFFEDGLIAAGTFALQREGKILERAVFERGAAVRQQRALRKGRQFSGQLFRRGAGFTFAYHAVGQPQVERFLRLHRAARQNQIERPRQANQTRQADRAAVDQRNPDASAEHAEHGIFLDHAQIAHRGQFEAAGDRMAGDRGDHRFAEAHARRAHRTRSAAVGVQFIAAALVGERGEVRAGAEGAACAEQHGRAPCRLRFETNEGCTERFRRRPIDGIAPRGPLEHDGGDAGVFVGFDAHMLIQMLRRYHRCLR
ncbi:hypothetical protein KCU90_g1641, partial [Aureobasidium melanogenum]